MSEASFDYVKTDGAPLKMWTRGVPVEDQAMQQLRNVALLPFIHAALGSKRTKRRIQSALVRPI